MFFRLMEMDNETKKNGKKININWIYFSNILEYDFEHVILISYKKSWPKKKWIKISVFGIALINT